MSTTLPAPDPDLAREIAQAIRDDERLRYAHPRSARHRATIDQQIEANRRHLERLRRLTA